MLSPILIVLEMYSLFMFGELLAEFRTRGPRKGPLLAQYWPNTD